MAKIDIRLREVQLLSEELDRLIKTNLQGEQVVRGELNKARIHLGYGADDIAETNVHLQVLGEQRAEGVMRHPNYAIKHAADRLGAVEENEAREQLKATREKASSFLQNLTASTEAFTELREEATPAFESLRDSDIQTHLLSTETHSAQASVRGALNVLELTILPELQQ